MADRLRERGCPTHDLQRFLREMDEHYEDLKAEGIQGGFTEVQASTQARHKLGSPELLAHRFIQVRQNRDWWGRHPRLLFGLGPLLVFILSFAGCAMIASLLTRWSGRPTEGLVFTPDTALWLSLLLSIFHFLLLLVIPALACRLASYYCYGWRWALVACLVLSVHCWFHFVVIDLPLIGTSGHLTWGYGFSNQLGNHLWKGLPPLLVFVAYALRFSKRLNASSINPILS